MKHSIIVLLVLCSALAYGQNRSSTGNSHAGEVSAGLRSTGSIFSSSGKYFGIGYGGQVRYRISDMINTEWFLDYISTDLGGLGQRGDGHFGVSAMIYPFKNPNKQYRLTPYVLGGFCGDYTMAKTNIAFNHHDGSVGQQKASRWSFATQMGLGTHFNLTERFDISLSTQYVLHFGRDIHTEVETDDHGEEYLHIHDDKSHGLEGHWFFTLSANFVLFDILKKK